jgi:hypothetical protein
MGDRVQMHNQLHANESPSSRQCSIAHLEPFRTITPGRTKEYLKPFPHLSKISRQDLSPVSRARATTRLRLRLTPPSPSSHSRPILDRSYTGARPVEPPNTIKVSFCVYNSLCFHFQQSGRRFSNPVVQFKRIQYEPCFMGCSTRPISVVG